MNINIEFDILMFLANNPDFRTARSGDNKKGRIASTESRSFAFASI